ncbi:MAG: hypothetical protein LBT12_04045 [Oscillospiraceae bacterium]|jgi:hypothetical protein|nr:hypothetical protein [Oscillospiraceae bacterium]
MTDTVMNTKSLPETLLRLIQTEKVRVREADGVIELMPIREIADCTVGLRGMFADCPNLSVDKFLERKYADKELEI